MSTDIRDDPYERAFGDPSNNKQFRKMFDDFCLFLDPSSAAHDTGIRVLLKARRQGEQHYELDGRIAKYLESRDQPEGESQGYVARRGFAIKRFFGKNSVTITIPLKYRSIVREYESDYPPLEYEEVRRMIEATPDLEKRAVICFLFQTGQPIGVLTGLRHFMVKECPEQEGKIYGIVTIPRGLKNAKGRSARKGKHDYQFGLHWESMNLIQQMLQKHGEKNKLVWDFDAREIDRIVDGAAKRAKVQEVYLRRLKKGDKKWKRTRIHPNTFRHYWINRMLEAEIFNPYNLEHQFGIRISNITRRWALVTEEDILAVTKKAAPFFEVLPKQSLSASPNNEAATLEAKT